MFTQRQKNIENYVLEYLKMARKIKTFCQSFALIMLRLPAEHRLRAINDVGVPNESRKYLASSNTKFKTSLRVY
jgi:hypothetical protein